MRELKGDWKDLFNGFMLALDLRKMFLGFCGIFFTLFGPIAATCWIAHKIDPNTVSGLDSYGLHDLWIVVKAAFTVIYCGTPQHPTDWQLWLPHLFATAVCFLAIWAYFGGAISRIAAYEIAKDGERIETARALQFAKRKFWAFFMSPWVCLIGFAFFFACNWAGGAIGRVLDFVWIGGPLVAIVLPLALLSGFVMTLIGLGTIAGFPLFAPAVAAEGTDAFDAMSRGFSYVYSRPWHYVLYQAVASLYGVVCISFVLLFAVTLCHAGIRAGGAGFDMFGVRPPKESKPPSKPDKGSAEEMKAWEKDNHEYWERRHAESELYEPRHDKFRDIADAAWALVLTNKYEHNHLNVWGSRSDTKPDDINFSGHHAEPLRFVYVGLMKNANCIVKPNHSATIDDLKTPSHRVAAYIVVVWLLIALGLALGYIPSYILSQQTLIYGLLRKRVDGIEMNEVFEETEEEPLPPEAAKAPEPSKPEPPPAPKT